MEAHAGIDIQALGLMRRMRRDLHQIPELDFDLPKTIAYVTRELEGAARRANANATREGLGMRASVFSPSRSAVCCHFDLGSANTTAIRSDMDALPVTERTEALYASRHEGRMHACGHDGHMSMALGLAWWLADHLDELPRSVLLVFQPAEETTGGARVICESGVFERLGVDRIFGFHLWPDLPRGMVASRSGALLASSNETTVRFLGRASHIAKAADGADALEAACAFLQESYAYVERYGREEPLLLKFGHMEAGQVRNQIAGEALLEGSLRTFSPSMGEGARLELPSLAQRVGLRFGCTASVEFSAGYPPVVNDATLYHQAAAWLRERGLPLATVVEPLLIAEDFAWYQQVLPGVFLLLGTGEDTSLHADSFDFDEEILLEGLKAYQLLVKMP